MCGICGFTDFQRDCSTSQWREAGEQMGEALHGRGGTGVGLWQARDYVLVHCRREAGAYQPVARVVNGAEYCLVCDSALHHTQALREELRRMGWSFETDTDAELILSACIAFGDGAADKLEGDFAFVFWDGARRRMLLCRDRLGAKPLFYARQEGALVFASEPKGLFAYPGLNPALDRQGLCQILGMGTVHATGAGVFRGVSEVEPGQLLWVDQAGLSGRHYWRLSSRPHREDYQETVQRIRELLCDSVEAQLDLSRPSCVFLSGGLDSSIVTALAARAYGKPVTAYSFDYTDNTRFFAPTQLRPEEDAPWAQRAALALSARYTALTCDIPALVELLEDAQRARDCPGMGDLDSSLLYFYRIAAQTCGTALSGDGADVIFDCCPRTRPAEGAPWFAALGRRRAVVSPALWQELQVEDYVRHQYELAARSAPLVEAERPEETRRRQTEWLAVTLLLPALLERQDRIGASAGLQVRTPFCNHRLVEYAWNIPWSMKELNGRSKQVLRDAAEGLLPQALRLRPRSAYPVACHPLLGQLLRARVLHLLDDGGAPIQQIVDGKQLRGRLQERPDDARATCLAWLIQLNAWLAHYRFTV